jgi:hypothetical protein
MTKFIDLITLEEIMGISSGKLLKLSGLNTATFSFKQGL